MKACKKVNKFLKAQLHGSTTKHIYRLALPRFATLQNEEMQRFNRDLCKFSNKIEKKGKKINRSEKFMIDKIEDFFHVYPKRVSFKKIGQRSQL